MKKTVITIILILSLSNFSNAQDKTIASNSSKHIAYLAIGAPSYYLSANYEFRYKELNIVLIQD